MIIVDAHEDLAWNILTFGRNYLRSVPESRAIESGSEIPARNGQTLIGWPEWIQGEVAIVFATLYAAPERRKFGAWEKLAYSNAEQAHSVYWQQLETYHQLAHNHADKFQLVTTGEDLSVVLRGWEPGREAERRVGLVLLMEGADGIREPDELLLWYEHGVRLVGPAWSGTRYAGGTGEPGPFTAPGHELLRRMEGLGITLDVSHLSGEAAQEAVEGYAGPIVATHNAARALMPNAPYPERHLSDDVIRGISARDGVIGVVLLNSFLKDGWTPALGREQVTLEDVMRHIDYFCQLTGSADHVGIGSDFDGGFGLQKCPTGLESIADLQRLGEVLDQHGYTKKQIEGIFSGNWLRLLRRVLPTANGGEELEHP